MKGGAAMSRFPSGGGVGNGDYLLDRLREEVSRATRHRIPLACLLFRVQSACTDDLTTTERLAHAASLLARLMVRDSDIVGALGSGCFGVLANASDEGARTLADALAADVRGFDFVQTGRHLDCDVAYGIACLGDGMTAPRLLEDARAALDAFPPLRAPHGAS
jgi:GGDEF domain-containing protein